MVVKLCCLHILLFKRLGLIAAKFYIKYRRSSLFSRAVSAREWSSRAGKRVFNASPAALNTLSAATGSDVNTIQSIGSAKR